MTDFTSPYSNEKNVQDESPPTGINYFGKHGELDRYKINHLWKTSFRRLTLLLHTVSTCYWLHHYI